MSWMFPSRGNGEVEGLGNGGLEMFKGNPLRSLAREICQNSLDACKDKNEPVRVEFELVDINTDSFPGLSEMRHIMDLCEDYWKDDNNSKTQIFIKTAQEVLDKNKISVLRISDYNTKGLQGAFDTTNIQTAWTGLVKSSAVSVKSTKGAAGSYGIGKNAPFVNSYLQTVFYRTLDIDGTSAVQGVARLMSFKDESYGDLDAIRRSVGYFSGVNNMPFRSLPELDRINVRKDTGTDLFIPGFKVESSWVDKMIGEILDNFLYSIYSNKLVVKVGNIQIDKSNVTYAINQRRKYVKDAFTFNQVLSAEKSELVFENRFFYNMGNLNLRLLYKSNLNQKILVVRNSGMKVAEIPRLPKQISFSGILVLEGDELNEYFRLLESPKHDKWEHNRHPIDPNGAKIKKESLENWVREIIEKKVYESIGEEIELDTSDYFKGENDINEQDKKSETLYESSYSTELRFQQKTKASYNSVGNKGNNEEQGFIDEEGNEIGFRHRTGKNGGNRKGRKATINPLGNDKIRSGNKEITYKARVVREDANRNKLIINTSETVIDALIEIVTMGENGKSLPLHVVDVQSENLTVYAKNGNIYIKELAAYTKSTVIFELSNKQNFALGVKVYGNKK